MRNRKVQRGGTVYEMNVNGSSAAAQDTSPVDSNHTISNSRGAWVRPCERQKRDGNHRPASIRRHR